MRLDYETSVVNSALWAAAGDALGWITELGGESTIVARTGYKRVSEPVAWRRRIGGRGGVDVTLPAGTYSDDTQLRLAVSRAIQANGDFDAEAFACVELTVWPSYALGAGRGSKAAASNLSKRGVNWFSNFFATKDQNYLRAGGNGAAMRIQPHVWASRSDTERLTLSVLRDSITTHGHTHGFCGAIFHALCLHETLATGSVVDPARWEDIVRSLTDLLELIKQDGQLSTFWLPAWMSASDRSLAAAIDEFIDEALQDINSVQKLLDMGPNDYGEILYRLGCFEDRYRGSGWKTALAASALAWLFRHEAPESALQRAVNTLGSDTDTIATMAGAILGAVAHRPPDCMLQDRDYLTSEAVRMARISNKRPVETFQYPDLSDWRPPASQGDALQSLSGGFALAGLGCANAEGEAYHAGGFIWQWFKLTHGQTIFAKRRAGTLTEIKHNQLPAKPRLVNIIATMTDQELPFQTPAAKAQFVDSAKIHQIPQKVDRIDRWTDDIIQSGFNDQLLGNLLNRYIDEMGSIEGAASFAAIVAKAKITRQRRETRR